MLANKLIENIPDPCNAKEHYQSYIGKKNIKSVKQSKIITYQPKPFENPNIVGIKSVIAEHGKTSHKLSKTTIRLKKWVLITLYIAIQKKVKGYASTYYVKILNSFNAELQLKDTESEIKSKLIDLLAQLKGFKFVLTLALVFTKIESEDKSKYSTFHSHSKAETNINESDIGDVFKSIFITII